MSTKKHARIANRQDHHYQLKNRSTTAFALRYCSCAVYNQQADKNTPTMAHASVGFRNGGLLFKGAPDNTEGLSLSMDWLSLGHRSRSSAPNHKRRPLRNQMHACTVQTRNACSCYGKPLLHYMCLHSSMKTNVDQGSTRNMHHIFHPAPQQEDTHVRTFCSQYSTCSLDPRRDAPR